MEILVAHTQEAVRRQLGDLLAPHGGLLRGAASQEELLIALRRHTPALLLLDLHLPGAPALDLLLALRERHPGLPVVVLAREEDQAATAQALLLGAADALRLPPDPHEVAGRIGRLLRSAGPRRSTAPRPPAGPDPSTSSRRRFVCRSAAMRQAVALLDRIAPSRSTVLLLGESGVGKELFARAIHYNSPRRKGPWVPLNCSAMPTTLIESELFGHERGAFTGAVERTRGKFEQAHTGTIFLDEVGEMSLEAQAKLLRVLEDREVIRVGGHGAIPVDVRLLAATNSDLEARIAQGAFRDDLYHRLNVILLQIPPLRQRREDLPELLAGFVEASVRSNGVPPRRVHPEVVPILQAYPWPGNVRELKNLVESLVLMAPGDEITPADLPARFRRREPDLAEDGALRPGVSLQAAERELIRRTLAHVDGHRQRAAALLGIGVRTLQRKIGRYGLR